MRVKVKSKIISRIFLKIEGRVTFVGEKDGQLVELVGDQSPGPEEPPRSKIGREKREQRKCQGRNGGNEWVCQGP